MRVLDREKRQNRVLELIVESHINTAAPIGSRFVSRKMGLSSATIRNVMQDLEEMGFIVQPHISAGRIPTDKGYRFYVDSLMRLDSLTNRITNEIEAEYQLKRRDIEKLIEGASKIISEVAESTSFALLSRGEDSAIKRIAFVPITTHRVLIVVVADSGMVKDAMLELEQGVAKEELERISTFLNSEYCGQPLDHIKSDLMKRLEGEKDSCYHMVKMASGLLQEGLLSDYGDKIYIEGSSRLFDQPEFADLNKRRKMARLLDEKYRLLNLMKGDMHDDGLKVHIGQENKDVDLKDCSIVTSNYKIGDKVIGTLGVIGPVRMGYSRIIPAIDYLSQMIGRMLAEMNEEWD